MNHLPKSKQEELELLTQQLSPIKEVEMVILFGSHARGNWVEDKYVEKGITYEYRSDFDILVALTHEDLKQKFRIEGKIKQELVDTGKVTTPVSLIFHGIKQLNASLTQGNYFFKDIKEEGIVLYDSEKFKLATPKKLTPEQYRQKAQDHFDQWFESAKGFLDLFEYCLNKPDFHLAAFNLHQATERFYTTILLVFTDYRPKDHNLENLGIKAEMCDARFAVFPKTTDEEKHRFELLKRAYIDARYKMDEYQITKTELQILAAQVNKLKQLTEEICGGKIGEIAKDSEEK
ncbi:HEPN domain-containing protein [Muricauda sp. 2012CJ35-5]|uniref:HEPN domain-containing protein n=1 Tax=Flagellimonas spongiicola TaxID=2942208 RepID=A0ABT0PSJ3_9FLAO|nr:HEPN domain-containing protein [Allomuricauda spongiicola]MCL6274231.1 HEPN domain-containing protein [Allomuricauda spongiicola]